MSLILYHGTPADFKTPLLSKCKQGEFGVGFYLTDSFDLALTYAKSKSHMLDDSEFLYIHEYEIEDEHLCCNLSYTKKDCETWEYFTNHNMSIEQSRQEIVLPKTLRVVKGPLAAKMNMMYDRDYYQYAILTQNAMKHLKLKVKYIFEKDSDPRDTNGIEEIQ